MAQVRNIRSIFYCALVECIYLLATSYKELSLLDFVLVLFSNAVVRHNVEVL